MERDIKAIVDAAEEVFWQKVAEMCPDIKTGDLSPDTAFALSSSMTDAVEKWLAMNGGSSIDLSTIEGRTAKYGRDAVLAAYDAINGNDGVDWALLEKVCPDGMPMGQFLDIMVGSVKHP